MKRRMKKLAALLLSAVMAMGVLSGCGSSGSGGTTESAAGTEAASAAEGASQEAGETGTVDTSEHVDLKMYLIGDRTPDFDEVLSLYAFLISFFSPSKTTPI